MATLTLGQMLDGALGSSRDGAVDFEQLHNLLNAMLIHLGLRDLLVKENGEPLDGAEESPFAFLKELKQRLEANKKEMAEMRTLCQDLREEVTEMKAEQSRMAEDMKTALENFDAEGFQNMLDDLRSQVLDAVMASMKDMMNQDEQDSWMKDGFRRRRSLDDTALIVIGNEITLVERTPVSRHWDTQSISLLSSNAKAQGREKDSLEAKESSHPASSRENDTGQNVGLSDMGRNMGQSDMGRKGMGGNVGQRNMGRNVRSSDTGRNNMEQNDMGQIKDEESKMSISKAPPHIQKKSPGGGFITSGMHPGAPATHLPAQRVQSSSTVQGHPGSQTLSIPAENAAGTSKLPTCKEAHGGDSCRMEPLPAEDALIIRKMPSSEYSSCDQLVQLSGRHSEIIPSTPPPSPGFSGRLPRAAKQSQIKELREQAAEGYSRRSPRYCGGRHTSTYPVQPMEPLLPDPNKPGVVELVGSDGFVYRGRTAQGVDSAHDSSLQK